MVSAVFRQWATSRVSLPEMSQLFQSCVQPSEISYSTTKIRTLCGSRPDFFNHNICRGLLGIFCGIKLFGNAIVLLEEEKALELLK